MTTFFFQVVMIIEDEIERLETKKCGEYSFVDPISAASNDFNLFPQQ